MKFLKIIKINLLVATTLSLLCFDRVELKVSHQNNPHLIISIGEQALAKRSGGRSRGGSFRKSSSSSRSRSSDHSPSSSKSSSSTHYHYHTNSGYSSYYVFGYDTLFNYIVLTIFGLIGLTILVFYFSHQKNNYQSQTNHHNDDEEKFNNIVAISKLQIALSSQAIGVQKQLSNLILDLDPSVSEELFELLQESILILLRNSDYWSYVQSNSFTLNIDKAESEFNRLSVAERSKFSAETLTNVDGKVRNQESDVNKETIPGYIVVTLLLGTADDKSLFKKIRSHEELKDTLEKLASTREDYLLKLEILWTPQTENDVLSDDEFLTEYTGMIAIG